MVATTKMAALAMATATASDDGDGNGDVMVADVWEFVLIALTAKIRVFDDLRYCKVQYIVKYNTWVLYALRTVHYARPR